MGVLRSAIRTLKVLIAAAVLLPVLLLLSVLSMASCERRPSLSPATVETRGGCGSRDGPGYRLANGRCASKADAAAGRR